VVDTVSTVVERMVGMDAVPPGFTLPLVTGPVTAVTGLTDAAR
jgi:hypothetical protein